MAAAMKRYTRGIHFDREVKSLTGVVAVDSRGRQWQLYEIRVSVEGNQFRLLFAHVGKASQLCLGVTALQKKQQALPRAARDRAVSRLKGRLG